MFVSTGLYGQMNETIQTGKLKALAIDEVCSEIELAPFHVTTLRGSARLFSLAQGVVDPIWKPWTMATME